MHATTRLRLAICAAFVAGLLVGWRRQPRAEVVRVIVDRTAHRLADGCNSVYLDIGTNIGVQIRKLFEPEKYPGADVHAHFTEAFGTAAERRAPGAVCVFGFEPAPWHAARLDQLERCYTTRQGWRVHVFRAAAHAQSNRTMTFLRENTPGAHNDWGASLFRIPSHHDGGASVAVQTMSIAEFVMEHVAGRSTAGYRGTRRPFVLAKMDVEGAEFGVLTSMLFQGALCHVDKTMIEWHDPAALAHPALAQQARTAIQNLLDTYTVEWTGCKTMTLVAADDETYLDDGQPWPGACERP